MQLDSLQIPFIGLSSSIIQPFQYDRLGLPSNPAYITNHFMGFSEHMTFLERVENTLLYGLHNLVGIFWVDLPGDEIARRVFGDDLPPVSKIANNMSLLLINTHFALDRPKPIVPGYVEVGGMFIGKPKKLPQVNIAT